MTKRIFTTEQMNILQSNPHVSTVTSKYITYTPEFKLQALHHHTQDHQSPKYIFITAGFDIGMIGSDTPKTCLKRWKRTLGITRKKGVPIGHKKKKYSSLQTEIAYLKAENSFLRQLRAKRAE